MFADEFIVLEMVDGTKIECIIQSSKNDFDWIENLNSDLQDLHEIVVTFKLDGNNRLDFPARIKEIKTLKRIV